MNFIKYLIGDATNPMENQVKQNKYLKTNCSANILVKQYFRLFVFFWLKPFNLFDQ